MRNSIAAKVLLVVARGSIGRVVWGRVFEFEPARSENTEVLEGFSLYVTIFLKKIESPDESSSDDEEAVKKPKRKKVAEEPPKVVPYPVKSTDQKTGLVCKMKEDETAGIWVFKNGSRTSYQCMVCLAVRRSVHKCNFRTLPY